MVPASKFTWMLLGGAGKHLSKLGFFSPNREVSAKLLWLEGCVNSFKNLYPKKSGPRPSVPCLRKAGGGSRGLVHDWTDRQSSSCKRACAKLNHASTLERQGRRGLTFVELQALGGRAAAPGVVGRLLPPVVPRVDVASELNEHLDEVHVLHLGRVVQGGLVKLRRVHIGPCRPGVESKGHQGEDGEPTETSAGTLPPSTVYTSNAPARKASQDSAAAFSEPFLKIPKQ